MPSRTLDRVVAMGALAAVPAMLAAASGQPQPRFGATAVGVVVDATVRDADGRHLTCLEASQFEVLEDGVPQRISSFEAVDVPECGPPESAASTSSAPLPPPLARVISTPPLFTALVFEELGEQGRAAAWHAANDFVREGRRPDEFVGVFVVERAVLTMVPYTRDTDALLTGLRRAAMRPGCPIELEGDIASAAPPSECRGGMSDAVRASETLKGLQAVAGTLAHLPGRKNILMFSEGFHVLTDSNAIDIFQRLTSGANRATVTFHTVDAAGLRTASGSADVRRKLGKYTGGVGTSGGPPARGSPASPQSPEGKLDAAGVLAVDPTAFLERLARDTGGQYAGNTNDIGGAVRRLTADMRDYYRLTYSPTNTALDGRYRTMTVKVRVPGAVVTSRNGYQATPSPASPMVAPHDVAPHVLLDAEKLPKDFALACENTLTSSAVTVVATVSGGALTFNSNAAKGTFEGGLTVLARVRGKDQRVLAAASETFTLSGGQGQLASAKTRVLRFSRELPGAGAVTLEVIAYDVLGRRASAQRFKVKDL